MATVLPAYGRKYKTAAAAQADWHDGKDFIESFERRAASKAELPGYVVIRYGDKLEKVTSYDEKIGRKIDKDRAKLAA